MRLPYFGLKSIPMNNVEGNGQRIQVVDAVRNRGSLLPLSPPRDIVTQSGPRGVLLSWSLPADSANVAGWKIYKDNESTLFAIVKDRGVRQYFVPTTAGANPPTVNIFLSSTDSFGQESAKVQVQASALAEAGAPTMPPAPPEYGSGSGKDKSSIVGSQIVGGSGGINSV